MHAHDFRDAEEFIGKKVLIVGSSYSAEDIASNMLKFGCKEIVASYRTAPMDFEWPKNMKTVPLLTKVDGRSATFKDGTVEKDFDCIMLCTGYIHHFPFMVES